MTTPAPATPSVHEAPSLLRSLFLAGATVALLALSLGALYSNAETGPTATRSASR